MRCYNTACHRPGPGQGAPPHWLPCAARLMLLLMLLLLLLMPALPLGVDRIIVVAAALILVWGCPFLLLFGVLPLLEKVHNVP